MDENNILNLTDLCLLHSNSKSAESDMANI